MKITRNETQWKTLIQNQQTGGLTISGYCQQPPLASTLSLMSDPQNPARE